MAGAFLLASMAEMMVRKPIDVIERSVAHKIKICASVCVRMARILQHIGCAAGHSKVG
jgi:hypothetical protein